MDLAKWHRVLPKIIVEGKLSLMLKDACIDIYKNMVLEDWELAYQVSACKSYIIGKIEPENKANAFQEDQENNEKILGKSVYCLLDSFHHDVALKINKIPSGVTIVSPKGVSSMKSKGTHPIIKRIKYEDKVIHEWAKKNYKSK